MLVTLWTTCTRAGVVNVSKLTLNAALPDAHREMFNRGGKTDLLVRADTLSSGAAPARISVCECK